MAASQFEKLAPNFKQRLVHVFETDVGAGQFFCRDFVHVGDVLKRVEGSSDIFFGFLDDMERGWGKFAANFSCAADIVRKPSEKKRGQDQIIKFFLEGGGFQDSTCSTSIFKIRK